jgi:cation transport ATPase
VQPTLPSHVRRLDASDSDGADPIDSLAYELVPAFRLRAGDLVLCVAGEELPADVRVVEGEGLARASTAAASPSPQAVIPGMQLPLGATLVSGYVIARLESRSG